MTYREVYYFAAFAVILAHYTTLIVKGQCTVEGCENGETPINIVAELQQLIAEAIRQQQSQQIQYIHEHLNASIQQMKNQQNIAMTNLQAVDRRSQEQMQAMTNLNASFQQMKNQQDVVVTSLEVINRRQNSWRHEIVQIGFGIDIGEVPILVSAVNNWIVLMRRFDGSMSFNRSWIEYKNGFGDMTQGEFWLGNEKIYRLTNRLAYTLRIEVQLNATGGWYYADYDSFSLDSEVNKYALRLSGFSGNAGDSLTNNSMPSYFNLGGMSFTTWDADNDRNGGNCASTYGGGWWYNSCRLACFTCQYNHYSFKWHALSHVSSGGHLRAARMMIKSK